MLGSPSPPPSSFQTVLLVDDEPEIGLVLKERLERGLRVRVLTATSGADALRTLREERVDLIITDQSMPTMTGLDFLTQAKTLAPQIPRAMLTAQQDLGLAVHAINDLGIAAYYPKPVDVPKLIESVKSILARKHADETREAGLKQASRVFQHEATMRSEKTRSVPFVGTLTPPTKEPREGRDE